MVLLQLEKWSAVLGSDREVRRRKVDRAGAGGLDVNDECNDGFAIGPLKSGQNWVATKIIDIT